MIDIFNMVFEALNAIFSPLLALDPNPQNPALTVLVIAFIVSLITTIANKLLVDQDEMNEIQQKMKDYQKEVREAQKSGDGKKFQTDDCYFYPNYFNILLDESFSN